MPRKSSIQLRAAEVDDAAGVAALYEQESVYSGVLQLPFPRPSIWQKRLTSDDPDQLHLLALAGEQIVGHGFLGRPHPHARRRHVGAVGMVVHPDWQRRGIGSLVLGALIERAERWMQMTRLELEVYCDNVPAVALYRKHGFVEEGRLRAYAFRDGAYVDVYAMARLKRD